MLYRIAKIVSAPAVRILWRPVVEGREHVPGTGPAILASNHLSVLDSFFLPALLPRKVTFVAKNEYFTGNSLTATFMRSTGNLSIDRESAGAAQAMLDAAAEVLKAGELFGIYPEGTRSPDGRLYKGKIGVAWLALTTGVPVIPVAMEGIDRVLPPGATVPRITRIGVRLGAPTLYTGDPGSARDRRRVTDQIMETIRELSGQEYVNKYAASVKNSS
ncbi:lysophospholipid acyltransferase family protein [Microtetraspora sp. NBRC 16547]|uniref:lysophospholipid acyltransferase family protein n=1 Tax=Microtetraspora sp. NBRC 16547 TaxID=3030993 RepID=UPI0024A5FAF7|nr:lysophospholipid acyltransferase family protein [Microtetraspora sp. NBRC 16547]GLX01876.1 1-acyl-sn-glycerol-3-phosphate acyltransferase [Microtetraspora sp. NBRC 16547]